MLYSRQGYQNYSQPFTHLYAGQSMYFLGKMLNIFSADIKSTWRWQQTLFNSFPDLFWWIRTRQISLFEMFISKIITAAIKLFRGVVIHLSASLEYRLSNSNWSAEGKSWAEKNNNVFWKENTCKASFFFILLICRLSPVLHVLCMIQTSQIVLYIYTHL